MSAFEFRTTPAIYVESGAAARLGQILRKRYSQERVCLVTDRFLHESGLLDPALADLKANGWTVQVIDDVIADPPEHIVLQATERARQAKTEIVVGLGGGSSMDVAKLLAVLLASPWIFYQIWAFVASGLHPHERRFVRRLAWAGALLFAAGTLFFLGVIAPGVFRFFIRFDLGLDYLSYQPGIGKTVDFILVLALVFGLAFQTPMAIISAQRMGLVSLDALRRNRKYVFLACFVVGAIATPPDVISQIALALPLYALYEAALVFCRLTSSPK